MASKFKKVTSKGEEAAVYDVKKTKGNTYNATNRHLISKLKSTAEKGKAGTAQDQIGSNMGFLKDIFHGPIQHRKLIKRK